MPTLRQAVAQAASMVVIGFVRVYQVTLGLLLGGNCRYTPSCSHYMIGAVKKYGPLQGVWKGLARIGRCHPWGGSGYDPP